MSHKVLFLSVFVLWVLGVGGSLNATLSDSAQQSTRGPPGVPTREFIVMLTFLPPVAFARGAARRPVGELCKKAPWKLCAVNFISVEWHCADKFLPHKLEAADGSAIHIQNRASADSKRNALLAALKSQATEATCAGHFELSNIDDESYWNHRSFADLIN